MGYESLLMSVVSAFWLHAGCCIQKFMEALDNVVFHHRVKPLPQREIGAEASPSLKPVPGLGLSWFAPLPPRKPDVLTRTPPTQLIHGLSALTNYRKIIPAFQRSLIFSLLFHEALEFCIFLEGKPAVCWRPPQVCKFVILASHGCQHFWVSVPLL